MIHTIPTCLYLLQVAGSGAAHARGSGKPEVAIVVSTAPTATCALKAGVLGCGSHSATLFFLLRFANRIASYRNLRKKHRNDELTPGLRDWVMNCQEGSPIPSHHQVS